MTRKSLANNPDNDQGLTVDESQQQFQIHLPGLLKVLAENLYSTKKVAIRELLQNAHDSCVRRSVEGNEPRYKPRIDIKTDAARGILTMSDNGSGLSSNDITNYLSTIGRSYTRELGEKLSILSPDEASQLIGQFGLGFLSAFLIGAEVTLTTRALGDNSQALRWRSTGDIHYAVTPAARDSVGTTVELQLKTNTVYLLNRDVLIEAIRQYADLLPIPIYVEGESLPVNLMTPPWEAAEPQTAIREYLARTFATPDPLCVIQLHSQEVDLGHDTITIPLKGFLFVPSNSIASLREYGDLTVFIRRMFICSGQNTLLPPWARFVRGVIDCADLQPTASREGVHEDDVFSAIQQALERQLLAGLRRIAHDEPATWKKIIQGHSDLITGWAVRNNEFFAQVADLVTFRTSRGLLNLPDYLALTSGSLYYVTREIGSLQEQLLGEARGMPVIDASWFAVTPFLEKYARDKPGVFLVQLDGDPKQLFRPVAEQPFTALVSYYRKQAIKVQVVTFKPEDVPALIIYPKDAEFLIDAHNVLDSGQMPAPLAGLIGMYLHQKTGLDDLRGTFYLNASCPFVQRLAQPAVKQTARESALEVIYQLARLFSGRLLTPADATGAFASTIKALETLST
ncbi:MAG: ATP-binding protein [Aggregatilineales bacterium]